MISVYVIDGSLSQWTSKRDFDVVFAVPSPWKCVEGIDPHPHFGACRKRRYSWELVAGVENESERVRGMELSFLHTRCYVPGAPTQINPDIDAGRDDQQRSHESCNEIWRLGRPDKNPLEPDLVVIGSPFVGYALPLRSTLIGGLHHRQPPLAMSALSYTSVRNSAGVLPIAKGTGLWSSRGECDGVSIDLQEAAGPTRREAVVRVPGEHK